MSVKTAMNSISSNLTAFSNISKDVIWQRPTDWLTLNTLGSSDQKVIALMAIFNDDSNYIAFTATGNYTVDWGDGTSENVNTGVKAQHRYNWADISSGTLTSEGFRQAIVTITPQSGQTLSTINFQQYHSDTNSTIIAHSILELKIAITSTFTLSNYITGTVYFPYLKIISIDNHGSGLSSTFLRGNAENVRQIYINKVLNIQSSGPFQNARCLEYIYINPSCTGTDLSNLFLNCYSLKYAPYFNTSSVTNMTSMFQNCYSLEYVPVYNVSSCTGMTSMFNTCISLKTVTIGAGSNSGTATNTMFQACSSLESVTFLSGFKSTTLNTMFSGCYKLKYVSSFNTSLVNNCSNVFNSCYSLEQLPLLDLSASINGYIGMFQNCYSLKSIPSFPLYTSATISCNNMFNGCSSLEYIPNIFSNTLIIDITSMFAYCGLLLEIPKIGMSGFPAGISSAFTNTNNLVKIGAWDLSAFTNTPPTLSGAPGLRSVLWYNGKYSYSYAYRLLDMNAINTIITNLGTAATTQTLTITGNPGANRYPALSRSSTTTSGSTNILCSNTASFITGMQVTGTGISTNRNITFQDAGDTVTLAGHGIPNGKLVSFATIVTTTGISVYVPYYVINATTDTFQLSLTQGGSAIALTTDGSGTMTYQTLVTNIVANTSVDIDIPASASGTVSLVYRNLNTQLAVMKRWTVSG